MAALAAARIVPQYGPDQILPGFISCPVADNVKIYPGAAIVISGGYAAPAIVGTGLISAGVYWGGDILDNTVAGHAAGAFEVPIQPGVFVFNNSTSTDLIAQANTGADCYWVDDNTVALTNGTSTRSRAGKVIDFDAAGRPFVQIAIGL